MISKKLNFLIFSSLTIGIFVLFISTYIEIKHKTRILHDEIELLEKSIKDEYKKRLKESVNHTLIFIDTSYKTLLELQKENKQNLTKENKQKLLDSIRNYLYSTIFEKSRYTWINEIKNFKGGDNYAIRLIHPNLKNTEGIALSTKTKDIKGNFPYLEELQGVKKNKEIFFTYYFKQINKNDITEKLSYAKLYDKLNWVIATGIPINDLNKTITLQKEKLHYTFNKYIFTILILRGIVLIIFVTLLLVLRKKLSFLLEENLNLNKKLELQVQSMKTDFNKFLELPSILFLISDSKRNIIQINKGWETILGYKKRDLENKDFLDLIHPKDKKATFEEVKKILNGRLTFNFENRYKHKNGDYRQIAWSANSIPEHDLIYAVGQDITELKDKTNLIYQQSKMAAIGEMTANIAHQWRQPLSIISIAASGILVKKDMDNLDDEFLQEAVKQIINSTQYLSDTIEDFRNFFSPNKEKSNFLTEDIINKTLNLIGKKFENQDIIIIKDIENIEVNNYENELLQVLLNLLNNARDQLIKQRYEDRYIFINIYEKNKKIYIEIIDNGKGINEKIIDRIFEPYFTTKDKSIGTGIGLYMSEEIVSKYLNGTIQAENHNFSYKDKQYTGAKFTIILD